MKLMTAAEGPNVTIARVRLKWIGTNFARESGEREKRIGARKNVFGDFLLFTFCCTLCSCGCGDSASVRHCARGRPQSVPNAWHVLSRAHLDTSLLQVWKCGTVGVISWLDR